LPIIINKHTSETEIQRIILILWYIWRARNDVRFKRKKWSVLQVHHAIEADIDVASACTQKDTYAENHRRDKDVSQINNLHAINLSNAGTHMDGRSPQTNMLQQNFRLGLPGNLFPCRFPMLLPGARCYTDAVAYLLSRSSYSYSYADIKNSDGIESPDAIFAFNLATDEWKTNILRGPL
jgi:hypothetical protein